MRNDWILDVLTDLRAFARLNGMEATAAGLEDASLVALAELSSLEHRETAGEAQMTQGNDSDTGNVTRLFATRGLA